MCVYIELLALPSVRGVLSVDGPSARAAVIIIPLLHFSTAQHSLL